LRLRCAFSESENSRDCTLGVITQSQDYAAPVHNLETMQFLLRTQVVIRVSIVNKGKEYT